MCAECGKGFYRKDHLRKHANSHAAKRLKEEINARASGLPIPMSSIFSTNDTEAKTNKNFESSSKNNISANNILFAKNSDIINSSSNENTSNENNTSVQITNTQAAISLSTVYVSNSYADFNLVWQ